MLQDFVELLQSATSGPAGSLQVVEASLEAFSLPEAYSLQHLTVQYSALSAALL